MSLRDLLEQQIQQKMMQDQIDRDVAVQFTPSAGQVANVTGMLVPGAGIKDAKGEYPALPSYDQPVTEAFSQEPYPSMAENLKRGGFGGYFDASMQGLGVAGDALYAAPVVGPVLGATIGTGIKGIGALGTVAKAAVTSSKAGKGGKGITALKTKPRERTSKEVLKQNFIEEHPAIGSIDNKTGNPVTQQLIKTRANAFEKGLSIPAVRRREELRIYNNTNPQIIAPERNIKTPEDLLGKVLVPVVGDRSAVAAGGIIDIKGVPLSQRIPIQGGPNYMIENAGTGKGWASMEDNANKKQMNMIFAADETGLDPYGVYSAMGRESINFSAPVATSMIAQLPALNIPKKQIKAFNDTIKKGIGKSVKPRPDFVGLDSDEIFNQMLGTGKFDRKGAGTLRTIVVEEMKKPRWQNMGFPLYDDVLKTINEPSLMDIKTGESGLGIFKGDPSKSTFPELTHQSYDTAIPGEYFGGLQESVPPEIMFPKAFETMSKRINSGGVPLPYQQQVGSLMMNPKLYEVADDQYVDQLIKYMNKNKGTNYATGGAVRSGIAAIATA